MAYCTYTDVQLEAGTATGTATTTDITNLIVRSDEEIVDALTLDGVSAPTTSTILKTASICLTIAKLKRRQAHELSRPGSLNLGGDISFSTSPETEAKAYEDKAKYAIAQYVSTVNGKVTVTRVRTRVSAVR